MGKRGQVHFLRLENEPGLGKKGQVHFPGLENVPDRARANGVRFTYQPVEVSLTPFGGSAGLRFSPCESRLVVSGDEWGNQVKASTR